MPLTKYFRVEFENFSAFLTSKNCRNWTPRENGRFAFLLRPLHFGNNRLCLTDDSYKIIISLACLHRFTNIKKSESLAIYWLYAIQYFTELQCGKIHIPPKFYQ